MKLKYKKAFFMTTTLIWGFGLLHLSVFPESVADAGPGPAPTSAAVSEAPTKQPLETSVPTPTATPTALPTPTATPSPLPEAITAPLTQATEASLIDTVSIYLHALYSNDIETLKTIVTDISELNSAKIENLSANIASLDNLVCYVKPGTGKIDTIVYACFDVAYKSSSVNAPLLEEIYLSKAADGSYVVYNETPSAETEEILMRARKAEDVMELSINSLIKRYFQAKLSCDPVRIRSCVNISNTELEILTEKVKHIEEYRNISCLIKPGINEFDYIVYVSQDTKIVSIDTPAPSLDEIYIYINSNSGKPYIYRGTISDESAEYAYSLRTSSDVVALTNDVTERLKEALASDDALREYCERLLEATTSQKTQE